MSRHQEPCCTCDNHKLYGLTCEAYDELLVRSGNRCEICRCRPVSSGRGLLHIDHGVCQGRIVVRGLLCSRCNTNLGRDGSWIDGAARSYLEQARRTWANLGYRPPELDVADEYAKSSQPAIVELVELAQQARESRSKAEDDLVKRNLQIFELQVSGTATWAAICRAVGLTREQVRRIVEAERKRHVEPDPPTPGQP